MRIVKLELKGYKRLALSGIDKLTYTPERNIQIILGRNMSGKSQLLRQLNPLPANINTEFSTDGYKNIEIEKDGSIYLLSSTAQGHSFILNNVEFNNGGTKKEQLELVEEHFNLTPAKVDIMLGLTKFVNMSPTERKSIITSITNIDYVYPIALYNRIKSKQRDLVGGIKVLRNKIKLAEQKLLKQEDITILQNDVDNLKKFRDYILAHTTTNMHTVEIVPVPLKDIETLLSKIVPGNIEKLKAKVRELTYTQQHIRDKLKELTKAIADIEKLGELKDIGKLREEANQNDQEIQRLYKLNKYSIDLEKSYPVYENWINIYPVIVSTLNELREYDSVRLGDREDILNKYQDLDNIVSTYIAKRQVVIDHIKQLQDENYNKKVTCDKCGNVWVDTNKEKIEELGNLVTKVNNELKIKQEELDKYIDLKNKLDRVLKLEESLNFLCSRTLDNLPNILKQKVNIKEDSIESTLTLINDINTNITEISRCSLHFEKARELNLLINQYVEISKRHKEYSKEETDRLSTELVKYSNIYNDNNTELMDTVKQVSLLDILSKYRDNLFNYLKDVATNYKAEKNKEYNKYLKEAINLIDYEIIHRENTLTENNVLTKSIEVDNQELEQLVKEESVLGHMEKGLSPQSGLIAKSLSSSINNIILDMNKIINSIWTYPVEILSCDIEEGDITYRFKVMVNDKDIIEDISKLSSSVQEIVNLAFRLVWYNRNKFTTYPLYLDEFGNTFDKEHRTIAYSVIDKLLSSDFSQMFIITHYNSLYGSLTNADFNVLDENNIDLSSVDTYNEHFIIER